MMFVNNIGNNSTFIIAEAGVNHNGDIDMAYKLIDTAFDAGANAVKFQTFKAEKQVTKSAPKAEYQKLSTDTSQSQYEMLKNLELDNKTFCKLKEYCDSIGIEFLSTAFDEASLEFIVKDLDLKTLKIPSGEITNGPLC